MTEDIENSTETDINPEIQKEFDGLDEFESGLNAQKESMEHQKAYSIPSRFIENKSNKQFDLINNANPDFAYELRHKWYRFEFEEPIYCKSIVIDSHNEHIAGLQVKAIDIDGKKILVKVDNKKSKIIGFPFNTLITGFEINPNYRFKNKIILKSITIKGYLESDFKSIGEEFQKYQKIDEQIDNKLEEFKTVLESFKEKTLNLSTEIGGLTNERDDLNVEVSNLQEVENETNAEIVDLKAKHEGIFNDINSGENNLSNLSAEVESQSRYLSTLKHDSIVLEREIKALESNKTLFAYDIQDYVKQGNRNINSYTLLSFLPWCIIAYVTWYLFNGAVKIINIEELSTLNIDILYVVLSRIPFTLIAGAIVVACYEFSKMLVKKIIEINTQKLRFSEIGVVAKDVVNASIDDIDLDNDDICDLRTKLKMDMLKHHLKGESLGTFDYEPKNPSIVRHLKDFIAGRVKGKEEVDLPKGAEE